MQLNREFLDYIVNKITPMLEKLHGRVVDFFFPKKDGVVESLVKYYHESDVSVIVIRMEDPAYLEEAISFSFDKVEDYLDSRSFSFVKVEDDLDIRKKRNVFNLIIKLQFVDDLKVAYTQSLTYKELFTRSMIKTLKVDLVRDIYELLNQYKESHLKRVEIRVDYIR
jgi:hypothetical protein